MARSKTNKSRQRAIKKLQELLSSRSTRCLLQRLRRSDIIDYDSYPEAVKELLDAAHALDDSVSCFSLASLIRKAIDLAPPKGIVHGFYHQRRKELFDVARTTSTHQAKRTLVHEMHLNVIAHSVATAVKQGLRSLAIPHSPVPIELIERQRDVHPPVRRYTILVEKPNGEPNTHVVDESNGYDIVDKDRSVIYYSVNSTGEVEVEFVVLRKILMDRKWSKDLYSWINTVIDRATKTRRNLRPGHKGRMVQHGLNAGPRHCRKAGWAKSQVSISDPEKLRYDDDEVMGAAAILWYIMKSLMPEEVIADLEKEIEAHAMPTMASRNISSGEGFTIKLGGMSHTFSQMRRSPPEIVLSNGYVGSAHKDPAFAKFSLHWNTSRCETNTCGSSFTDTSLRVSVRQAEGTMFAFKPNYIHGTTIGATGHNRGLGFVFTQRVGDLWAMADQQAIIAAAGKGSAIITHIDDMP